MGDIGSCYQPKSDPEVINGTKSTQKALSDFFQALTAISNSGYLTEEQFLKYYENVACFEDDESFETLIRTLWKPANPTTSGGGGVSRGIANLTSAMRQTGVRTIDSSLYVKPLQQVKAALKAKGASGIIGLSRAFRIMDDNGNKSLDASEFKKGMADYGLHFDDEEIQQLFQYFLFQYLL